jgi:cobaltochelatase CobN
MKAANHLYLVLCSVFLSAVLLTSVSFANDKDLQEVVKKLASSNKPVVLLMQSSHSSASKTRLIKEVANNKAFNLFVPTTKGFNTEKLAQLWQHANLVLLDGINPALSKFMFHKHQALLSQFPQVKTLAIGDSDDSPMNHGIHEDSRKLAIAYYLNGGRQNYRYFMDYISSSVLKLTNEAVPPVFKVPEVGLYHPSFPSLVTDNEQAFFDHLNNSGVKGESLSPTVAIAMYRNLVDYEQRQVIDKLIAQFAAKGSNAFGFFFENEDAPLNYADLLLDENNQPRAQIAINYRSLHYVEKRKAEFNKLGIPIIHALNYLDGNAQAFKDDHSGVSANMTPFFLVMPESTGSIDPVIITAKENNERIILTDQLSSLVDRAYNHGKLAKMENSNKKLATFIWNYPPGEKNIGAAFLDVPNSLVQISTELKKQGYKITSQEDHFFIDGAGALMRPFYRKEDVELLISKGLADYLPLNTYLNWFNQLPKSARQPIIDRWGKPENNGLVREHNGEKKMVIPRMEIGNMIVLPQGMRSDNAEEHASLYHSTKTPINHAYLAFYLYARDTFGADAIIHLGTHGSQEWLTGKERGLSVFDAPNLAIGNIPVFYPYIIDNVGEAMQAKRRGRATMISHLTPGFAKAGLYREISELNELINNFFLLDEGATQSETLTRIIAISNEMNILADLELTLINQSPSLSDDLARMQDYLVEMSQMSQPLGVHIFGLTPKESHIISTMLQMLGEDFVQSAGKLEQQLGWTVPETQRFDEQGVIHLYALKGFQLLKRTLVDGEKIELPETLTLEYLLAEKYWKNFNAMGELSALIDALDAKYIAPGNGNDPIRNPDAIPTGKNLIGFNPSKVPSQEAYVAGAKVMEQTLSDFFSKHGKYPKKLAFSLWSLETMRHQGALEAQILHAMGVKPVWDKQGRFKEIAIIPYSELKRPRVDVVVSATGLYRDAFPNVMLWLADAIDKVAKLKEDNNFVYRHSVAFKEELIEQGKDEKEADYLSSVRIFSNESGNYGTGLAAASLASDTWDSDNKLSELYTKRMGYFYGKDEDRWSDKIDDVDMYTKMLSGTEAVVFSRSSNLYALMTNDDPFQYFGGIGLAVRNIDGKTPEMYVANLRRKDAVKSESMDKFLNKELRSRYFHPRWIEKMQESGYAGSTAILDRLNNFWGWTVMTPEYVRDDQWQQFFEVYVNDAYDMNMKAFFEKANPAALAQMIERMIEAERKNYWQTDEKTMKKMVKTYLELVKNYDLTTQNEKFNEYVNNQALGFGLAPLPSIDMAAENATQDQASEQTEYVQGQQLEQQTEVEEADIQTDYLIIAGLMLLIFGYGFYRRDDEAPSI